MAAPPSDTLSFVDADAFFANVVRTRRGCLEWKGTRTFENYGRLFVRRRSIRAHRLAWELVHGPIPDGLCVCHQCDNPPCVNPDHLFLGSHQDNNRDAVRKGRSRWARKTWSRRRVLPAKRQWAPVSGGLGRS